MKDFPTKAELRVMQVLSDAGAVEPAPKMTELEFYKAFIEYCENGGHSYSHGEICYHWQKYQRHPEEYEYLNER
jgi:hypothetical protein